MVLLKTHNVSSSTKAKKAGCLACLAAPFPCALFLCVKKGCEGQRRGECAGLGGP